MRGHSDIVTWKTYTRNKVYTKLKGFFTINSTFPAKIMQAFPLNY